ncbi:carboxynorspermidine decarboxylase [Algivirga pacifica]|uniref:Carboxynorspermidine/carboxyspermidine decarboxylase n=1 Tax=Algivirga pacifica TaxID=1162670 RepID=A0ABP9DGC9_9BACT
MNRQSMDINTINTIPSPCYVIEEELLENNLKVLDMVQKASGGKVILALKGFSTYHTFPMVKKYLPGVTASSLNEALLGVNEFGGEIHAYSPVYLPNEIDGILEHASHVTFNSLAEWERYKEKVKAKGVSAGLRINPEYSEVTTDLYNPCVVGSRLGVRAEQIGDELPEGIEGLHFHTLCENGAETLERTLEAVEERFGHLLHQAKWLNMGGGHAITRKGYDTELLINLIQQLRKNYNLQVILEPGSAVGWETGPLISTVLDIVENQGTTTAMLDVSFAAHMPDTLEMPYKPRVRGAVEDGKYHYNLGGTTCLAGDFMAGYSFEAPLKVGDKIILEDMIHYTMVKTTTFNGVNLPSIGMYKKDGSFELFKSFGYESYKDRL